MSEMPTGPKWLTLRQAALHCEVHHSRVRKWCRGVRVGPHTVRLAADVVGDRIRIRPDALERFLADCRVAMFGPEAVESPAKVESPRQEQKRVERMQQEALRACGVIRD